MFFVLVVIIDQAITDHFKVVGLVPLPSNECKAEVDLVLTQTSFVFLWKCMLGKNNMIYMYTTKLQGLYQNNVNSRTIFITVKWA